MAVGTQRTDPGVKAEANYSRPQGLRRALQMGKVLKTTNTQQTDSGPRVVLQRMAKVGVVAEQQIDIYLQATAAHQTGVYRTVVLQ